MKNTPLQPAEIRELIQHYQAELRKMEYQILKTQAIIEELAERASPKEEELPVQEKRGRGRPKTKIITPEKPITTNETTIIAPTDPKEKKRVRLLSEWDELVINYLTNKNKIAIATEFNTFVIEKNELENLGLPVEEAKERISRSLHKLANKRGDLVKIKRSEGRGFGYALPQWLNAKGALKQKYNID